ncbi:MAG TPA: CHAP domain-containing protein, partial [Candidatus Saccharimonas sp.]|nr:CHAP domain-containing protein [Candidatus Saccharimonas sp.]
MTGTCLENDGTPALAWGDKHNDESGANIYSSRGYAYRNCTDYVAWKLQSLGVASKWTSGLGNGGNWYDNVPAGLRRGSVPAVGAAAVWPAGVAGNSFGHVAYVEAVNSNGTITVSEYNYSLDGTGDTRTDTPAHMHFTEFVYFADKMTNPPGNGGNAPPPALTGASPIQNGGFNQDTSHWSVSGTANLAYNNASSTPNVYPYE